MMLDASAAGFEAKFDALVRARREPTPEIDTAVAAILADVRRRGDAALVDLTRRFEGVSLTPKDLRFSKAEIEIACAQVSAADRAALTLAAERIRAFHHSQIPQDCSWVDPEGVTLGWRWTPLSAAGLYVPGGLASYPSSVLMSAIPAKVAGVSRLVITVPTPGGAVNPLVLMAAQIAGVDEIYRIGGAQAIAALAYGTPTLAAVDKIAGPGNAYVSAAKRQVFGIVGIDMVAGPSEILVIAEGHNNPHWIALDLLSQAEHDEMAQAVLITDDSGFAQAVAQSLGERLARLARRPVAAASWHNYGAIITVPDLTMAAALSNRIAPEHLQLCVAQPEALLAQITHAGAIFLGPHTPEAIGDYIAGPSHVLPTSGAARFSSGLSVADFMKRTTLMRFDPQSLRALGPAAVRLAHNEGLHAHAQSVQIRLDALNDAPPGQIAYPRRGD